MKKTKLIAAVMAICGAMVILGGVLNLADVVAISGIVVGKQAGGWYGGIAFLSGIVIVGVFAYAYRKAIWNWWIRGTLIALSGVIFLVSAIGMSDNTTANFEGGGYQWSTGRDTSEEEIIRVVPETFVALDLDSIVLMMLIGSIGVAATALWGAFRWESAKIEETHQDEIRNLLDELPPDVLRPGANYREELELYYGNSPRASAGQPEAGIPPAPSSSTNHKRCPQCWTDLPGGATSCHNCGAGS